MQMSADNKKRDGVTTVVQFSALTKKRLLECMGHRQLCYADDSGQQEKGWSDNSRTVLCSDQEKVA